MRGIPPLGGRLSANRRMARGQIVGANFHFLLERLSASWLMGGGQKEKTKPLVFWSPKERKISTHFEKLEG